MNFLKKLVFIPVLGLMLTGCDFGGTQQVDAAVANERVAQAMGQTMMSGETDTLSLDLSADLELVMDRYEDDEKVASTSIDASATLDLKAKDLSSEDIEASINATASLVLTEQENGANAEEVFNGDMSANLYLSDMWLYVHLTGVNELLGISTEEDELKGKTNIEGMLDFEELPIPDSVPTSEEFDEVTDMMKTMLMEVDDVDAVEKNGDLVVTYNITVADIVDVIVAATTYFESDLTASEIEEFRQEGMDVLGEALTINTAKIVVGISKLGYLNQLDIDVDMEIDSGEYEMYDSSMAREVISIDALVEFDMEINGNVTITPPTGLDEYEDMNQTQMM